MARYNRNTAYTLRQMNAELEKVQDSIGTMLDREGTAPNQMLSSIDMNGFRIYNLQDPSSNKDAVNKEYVDSLLAGTNAQGVVPIVLARQEGDGSTVNFTILNNDSTANSFFVFLDGVAQKANTDYTVSGTTLTFTEAPANNVSIDITYFEPAVLTDIPTIVGGVVSYEFDTVVDAQNGTTIGGQSVTLKVNDVIRIKARYDGVFDVVLTSTVTPNGFNIIQLDSDPTLSAVLRTLEGHDLNQYGLIADDATDQTTNFNSIMALIPNDSYVTVNEGEYLISGGLIDSKNYLSIQAKGDVYFYHPVEGDTGRTTTVKNIEFNNCDDCKIFDFRFKGEHTNAARGDNAYQSAISLISCSNCSVYRCVADDLQRCFIAQSSVNTNFYDCIATTSYNSFFSTSSSKTRWFNCRSVDSYWGTQFEGVSTPLATGWGFLADQSSDCLASNCESIRSGSDCFRSSANESSRNKWVNCKSFQPRRNSFSHRDTTSEDNTIIDCEGYDIGDPSFWNGAAGSYTEPATNARGYYLDAPDTIVKGGIIRSSLVEAESNMLDGIWVNQDRCQVEGVKIVGYVDNAGIEVTSSASACQVSDNNIQIQVLTVEDPIYCYNFAAGTNHTVTDNRATGGLDCYLLLADGMVFTDNRSLNAARHGFHNASEDCIYDGNISVNCGQASAAGAGHYMNDINITCGTNIAVDNQGTTTMYRAIWITANATGLFTGTLVNRSTVTDLRDDAGAATRSGAVFGKGVSATDIATLLTSLEGAELIDS